MAKTIARFMILAKSDRMGSKDKKEEEKNIRYTGIVSYDKIDLTTIAKEISIADYWTTKDIDVKPQEERFAVVEVMKEGHIRVLDVMTKEEYIASLGL